MQFQPGRRHDDVGGQLIAVVQAHTALSQALDLRGEHTRLAALERRKEIAVRHQAQALIPGVVARREMGQIRGALQAFAGLIEQQLAHFPGLPARAPVEPGLKPRIFPARQTVGPGFGQQRAQGVGEPIARGARHHPGRRALQHNHLGGLLRHRGHQGNGGRSRTDDDHALAGVIEVLGPMLGVNEGSGKRFASGKIGLVAAVIAVVAGAQMQETRAQRRFGARCGMPDRDLPILRVGLPIRTQHPLPIANQRFDAKLGRGFPHIAQDRRPVGNRPRFPPRFEGIAQRVHIAVRAHARVAKQIPGAAAVVARLDNTQAAVGTFALEMAGRADTREPGADNQYVDHIVHATSLPVIVCFVVVACCARPEHPAGRPQQGRRPRLAAMRKRSAFSLIKPSASA